MQKEDRSQANYVVPKTNNCTKREQDPSEIIEVELIDEWTAEKYFDSLRKDPNEITQEQLLARINKIILEPFKSEEDAKEYKRLTKIYKEKFDKEYKTYNFSIYIGWRVLTYFDPPLVACWGCNNSPKNCTCKPLFFDDII